jgi:ribonuclease P protein component
VPDHSFPKRLRLLRPADFERVFAARRSAADRLLTVYGLANECGHARLGLVASRRIGNAVIRNRWKRLLREVFRHSQHELPSLDLICIPRSGSEPDLASLQQSLKRLAGDLARKSKNARHVEPPGGSP